MSSRQSQAGTPSESSPSGKRSQMKSQDISVEHKPGDPPLETGSNWDTVNALTKSHIHAAPLADPDAQPIPPGSEEDLARLGLRKLVNVKRLRDRLGMT